MTRQEVTDLVAQARIRNCITWKQLAQVVGQSKEWTTAALLGQMHTDPLIYRLYEIVNVYGSTIKELIHEEFGDGIMSAIDFSMEITREPDPHGDRVRLSMSGKYLGYKTY